MFYDIFLFKNTPSVYWVICMPFLVYLHLLWPLYKAFNCREMKNIS